jgi:hypothetical protein
LCGRVCAAGRGGGSLCGQVCTADRSDSSLCERVCAADASDDSLWAGVRREAVATACCVSGVYRGGWRRLVVWAGVRREAVARTQEGAGWGEVPGGNVVGGDDGGGVRS